MSIIWNTEKQKMNKYEKNKNQLIYSQSHDTITILFINPILISCWENYLKKSVQNRKERKMDNIPGKQKSGAPF